MKKGLILLADGFEQTEAFSVQDVLLRAGLIADLVSTNHSSVVVSSMELRVSVPLKLEKIDASLYDFIIIPGGTVGVENLSKSKEVLNLITYFHENKKLICSICAGPSILGKLGYLDNHTFTCFPGYEVGKGKKDTENGVVDDGLLITARSMYFSIPFAEAIIKHFSGQKGVDSIYFGTRGAKLD